MGFLEDAIYRKNQVQRRLLLDHERIVSWKGFYKAHSNESLLIYSDSSAEAL